MIAVTEIINPMSFAPVAIGLIHHLIVFNLNSRAVAARTVNEDLDEK